MNIYYPVDRYPAMYTRICVQLPPPRTRSLGPFLCLFFPLAVRTCVPIRVFFLKYKYFFMAYVCTQGNGGEIRGGMFVTDVEVDPNKKVSASQTKSMVIHETTTVEWRSC